MKIPLVNSFCLFFENIFPQQKHIRQPPISISSTEKRTAARNYRGYFGGSTWEPITGTDKFYLHSFAKKQPDLNWENPTLRPKIYDMVNWWLEKGLAGFRLDAIINIKKDPRFPSYAPDGPHGRIAVCKMIEQAKGIGTFLQELKQETFEKYDTFTVGEGFHMWIPSFMAISFLPLKRKTTFWLIGASTQKIDKKS